MLQEEQIPLGDALETEPRMKEREGLGQEQPQAEGKAKPGDCPDLEAALGGVYSETARSARSCEMLGVARECRP